MSEQFDSLTQLWQAQQVDVPDMKTINKRMVKERVKQYLYMAFDVSSLIPLVVIIYLFREKLGVFEFIYLSLICAAFAVFVVYLIYLRRKITATQTVTTHNYLSLIDQHIAVKLRILKLTKWSILAMAPVFLVLFGGIWIFSEMAFSDWLPRILKSSVWLVVSCGAFWIWVSRRQRKFELERERVRQQCDGALD